MDIAVLIPTHNARHLLWRSLASLAAQTRPPARIVVLDEGSLDGLADWLRVRWPAVELAAGGGSRLLDDVLAGLGTAIVTFLEPGATWAPDQLDAVATAWQAAPEAELVTAPAVRFARQHDGSLRPASASSGEARALSALATRREFLVQADGEPVAGLPAEILRRLNRATNIVRAESARPVQVVAAIGPQAPTADLPDWLALLDQGIAALPPSSSALLLDLHAASLPAGLFNLLGLATVLGPTARRLQALTLADFTWKALESMPATAPVFLSTPTPLDLGHANDQLLIEELVGRAGKRPVRLVVRAFAPSSPTLLSRLIERLGTPPDLELWLHDAVSMRYALSLLGPARVRLTPPPLLALAPVLRDLGERQLLQPLMLHRADDPPRPDLEHRLADLDRLEQGFDTEAARRLALPLARVLGLWRAIKGPVLHHAWTTALIGWAAARGETSTLRTTQLDAALYAAMCGHPVMLQPCDAKTADFVRTWRPALTALGIGEAPDAASDVRAA